MESILSNIPIIELELLCGPCIIVSRGTGFIFDVGTFGAFSYPQSKEGFILPIIGANGADLFQSLDDICKESGVYLDENAVSLLNQLFGRHPMTKGIRVDPDLAFSRKSGYAWIYVILPTPYEFIEGMGPSEVILTWPNDPRII